MKNKKNEFEERLLSNASLDELIKIKMDQELSKEIEASQKKVKKQIIKNIKDVPKDKIFSKETVYKIFNRKTRSESYINGIQAESLIGLQNSVRENIRKGLMDAFSTDSALIRFEYCKTDE